MSTLPQFAACDGPLSLRQFLSRYLLLDVLFTARTTHEPATSSPSHTDAADLTRRIELPVTEHLVLSVYVLKNAPPPPIWTRASAEVTRTPFTTASLSSSSQPAAPAQPSLPMMFARHAQQKRMTRAVLADPLFAILFARLGRAVEAYMNDFCPLVAQFNMHEGGLQVMGPSLLAHVPLRAGPWTARTTRAQTCLPGAAEGTHRIGSSTRKRSRSEASTEFSASKRARRTRRSLSWRRIARDRKPRQLPLQSSARDRHSGTLERTGTSALAWSVPDEDTHHAAEAAAEAAAAEAEAAAEAAAAEAAAAEAEAAAEAAAEASRLFETHSLFHALRTADVIRTVLLHRRASALPRWEEQHVPQACPDGSERSCAVPERWMDALWDANHTHSKTDSDCALQQGGSDVTSHNALTGYASSASPCTLAEAPSPPPPPPQQQHGKPPRKRCRRRRRGGEQPSHAITVASVRCPRTASLCDVSLVEEAWVPLLFPFTFTAESRTADGGQRAASSHLAHGLRTLVASVVCQCRRVDVRGLVLRHTQFLENRLSVMLRQAHQQHQQQQNRHRQHDATSSKSAVDVSKLSAPVDVVVSYLRTLLASLKWHQCEAEADETTPSSSHHGSHVNTAQDTQPFWGIDPDSAETNLNAICATLRDWLNAGRRGTFSLERFLHGVHVSRLPWLHALFTETPSRKAGRGQASQKGQRVFLECMFFLTQHILPFFVARGFHVTWSSRDSNTFVFIPALVWRRLVKRELRLWAHPLVHVMPRERCGAAESVSASTEVDAFESGRRQQSTSALSRIQSANDVWRQTATSPFPCHVLYASLRCLPDRHKLRPIATVRCAHAAALWRFARGIPRRPRLRPPPSTTGLPSPWHGATQAHPPPSVLLRTALACLVTGLDEHRAKQGLPALTNRTHADEYAELRALAVEYQRLWCVYLNKRACACDSDESSTYPHDDRGTDDEVNRGNFSLSGTSHACHVDADEPPVLSLIHADATRCYDSLPQSAVAGVVTSLIQDAPYYTIRFAAIRASRGLLPPHTTTTTTETTVSAAGRTVLAGRKRWHSSRRPQHEPDHVTVRRVGIRLYQSSWTRMVPASQLEEGQLRHIPAGVILCEPASGPSSTAHPLAAPLTRTSSSATAAAASASRAGALCGDVVDGYAVRDLLLHHIQNHLIAVPVPQRHVASTASPRPVHAASALFSQHVGISQGSPVAMLLCDALFERVDAALTECLGLFDAYGLLLRRVDDVLIATTSPVAAAACVEAVRRGWQDVGYQSEASKLHHVRGGVSRENARQREQGVSRAPADMVLPNDDATVPWCGLRVSAHTAEISVDWSRFRAVCASLHRSTAVGLNDGQGGVSHLGERRLRANAHRFITVLALRTPPTTFCRIINSRVRVLRTVYELCLLTARFLLRQLAEMLPWCRPRLRLFLGPYRLCERRLMRLVAHHRETLAARFNSSCDDVRDEHVRLCLCVATHRTLQSQLRRRMAESAHGVKRTRAKSTRTTTGHHVSAVPLHTDRGRRQLWWALALRLALRSRRGLRLCTAHHYLSRHHNAQMAKRDAETSSVELEVVPWWRAADTVSSAALLLASGEESLSALALAAVGGS